METSRLDINVGVNPLLRAHLRDLCACVLFVRVRVSSEAIEDTDWKDKVS